MYQKFHYWLNLQFVSFTTHAGVIFTEGQEWQEQRRFTMRSLRDFGFGKKSLESIIQQEICELIENLQKECRSGAPISTTNKFNPAVLNAIWTIMMGERFKQDDPELAKAIGVLTA